MSKKTKYNPSKYRVLTSHKSNKGEFIKRIESGRKRLNRFSEKSRKS